MAQSSKAAKRERQRQNRAQKLEQQAAQDKKRRFWRSARGFIIILIPIALIFAFLAIRSGDDGNDDDAGNAADRTEQPSDDRATPTTPPTAPAGKYSAPPPMTIDPAKTYVATVETSEGSFDITLDPTDAPQTVNSFVFLAREGYYDGLTFHRIVTDFVIQGGDPSGDGTGGPGYTLPDEPPSDGYRRYSVAMANSGPGSTGSQFFVVTTDSGATQLGGPPYLYSDLGTVTSGQDVVDRINGLGSKTEAGTPTTPVTITRVTITEQ